MTKPKFTPGPWHLDFSEEDDWTDVCAWEQNRQVDEAEEIHIATVEGRTDARLIAAAPDLYEALLKMFSEFPENGESMNAAQSAASDAARAALAKVDGNDQP